MSQDKKLYVNVLLANGHGAQVEAFEADEDGMLYPDLKCQYRRTGLLGMHKTPLASWATSKKGYMINAANIVHVYQQQV